MSADGEYLGGIISPGVEISIEALTERAAALPKIDLVEPRTLIGKTTIDAIRSGVVYGFAGLVDGDRPAPARRARRGDRDDRHRRPGRRDRSVHCDEIDEIDDLLTLTGLRCCTSETVLAPRLPAWQVRSLHRPLDPRRREVPNRVVLAPLAGIGNWFVRLQAKRYGAGLAVSEMVSSSRSTTATRRRARAAAHPPREQPAARSRSSCSATTRSHALGRRQRRAQRAPT